MMLNQIKNVSPQKNPEYPLPAHFMLKDTVESNNLDYTHAMSSLEIILTCLKQSQKQSLSRLRVIYTINFFMLNTYIYIIFFYFMQNTQTTIELKNNPIDFLSKIGKEESISLTYIMIKKDPCKR